MQGEKGNFSGLGYQLRFINLLNRSAVIGPCPGVTDAKPGAWNVFTLSALNETPCRERQESKY